MSTIIDVAKAAGVSPMTVSRYFNQPSLLRPSTREKVEAAVEVLKYVPNHAARSLVQGRTDTIALVVADITNAFFTTFVRGSEDRALELGYTLILGNSYESFEKERQYLNMLISKRVDGVIISPTQSETTGGHNMDMLTNQHIPVVLIDRKITTITADVITADSVRAARLLVDHLVDQGYRRIAFIGGKPGVSSFEERASGYRQAMLDHGLTPQVHAGRYDRSSGNEILTQLIEEGALPEAIIAANNLVAVGALVALRLHGLHAPEDIAVTCYDDLEAATLIDPYYTVVVQPGYDMGRAAMDLLHERIGGLDVQPREKRFPFELVIRKSSIPGKKAS